VLKFDSREPGTIEIPANRARLDNSKKKMVSGPYKVNWNGGDAPPPVDLQRDLLSDSRRPTH
jgi:hypothetical protein